MSGRPPGLVRVVCGRARRGRLAPGFLTRVSLLTGIVALGMASPAAAHRRVPSTVWGLGSPAGTASARAAAVRPCRRCGSRRRVRTGRTVVVRERRSRGIYSGRHAPPPYFEFEPAPHVRRPGPIRLPSAVGAPSVVGGAAPASTRSVFAGLDDPVSLLTNTDLHDTLLDPGYATGSGWE